MRNTQQNKLEDLDAKITDILETFERHDRILTLKERNKIATEIQELLKIKKLSDLITSTKDQIDSCIIDWTIHQMKKRAPENPQRLIAADDIRASLNDLQLTIEGMTSSAELKQIFQSIIRPQLLKLLRTVTTDRRKVDVDRGCDPTSITAELEPHIADHGDADISTIPNNKSGHRKRIKERCVRPSARNGRRPASARMH